MNETLHREASLNLSRLLSETLQPVIMNPQHYTLNPYRMRALTTKLVALGDVRRSHRSFGREGGPPGSAPHRGGDYN